MSANLGSREWGAGESLSLDREAQGAGGQVDERVDELIGLDAKQAIESLSADLGAGNADLDAPAAFPGPIAEAAYWDDGAIVGIQGPVGSGKTTTMLKSRLRRAMAAPCSVIDGRRRYKLLVIRATYRQLWSTTIPDFLKVFPKHLGEWSGGRGGPVTFTMLHDDGLRIDPPPGHTGDWSNEILFIVEFMAFGDDIQGSLRGYQATDMRLVAAPTQAAIEGKPMNAGRAIARFQRNNTPVFSSMWYARTAFSRIVSDNVQRFLDPEAEADFRRKTRQQKKDYGSEAWWGLGRNAPSRAPDLSNAIGDGQ